MTTWRLEVLGTVGLHRGETTLVPERKTAAVLAFVALEGPTPRSRLAGLFWPESPEATARNNLAALARRLKRRTGTALLGGTDALALCAALEVDAAIVRDAARRGEHRTVLENHGPFLAPFDYDDLPAVAEWRRAEDERLLNHYREALRAEGGRLEEGRAYREAARLAERLWETDPASEEACRWLMRLRFLAGDRPAALAAYRRLRETLQREFGVAPLPETAAVAAEIARAAPPPPPPSPPPRSDGGALPLRILRPPLIGREAEWALLEDAWQTGKIAIVSGPPGSGKSRLMLDFAASKGSFLVNEGRPGDAAVPFVSLARAYRRFLAAFPATELPPWVRREVARLLPELMDEAPPTLPGPDEQLRFHEAMYRTLREISRSVDTLLTDDLQFYDASSFDVSTRATGRLVAEGEVLKGARTIACFRRGEMDEAFLAGLRELVDQGLAVHLELAPFGPDHVEALLGALALPALAGVPLAPLAGDLHRYTGGNPFLLTETLKHLLETDRLGPRLPRPLAPAGRPGALVAERLRRLSEPARRLAWTAAVAEADFSAELAGAVLEQGVFELAAPFGELERAQIFQDSRFSHDLLYEAALAEIPASLRPTLHRRCAAFLQHAGGSSARIARHFLAADEPEAAAPFLLAAAADARSAFRLDEAAGLYGRAADILERLERASDAFEALWEQASLTIFHGMKHDTADLLERLDRLAATPLQRAKALHARVTHLNSVGEGHAGEALAREGLALARTAGDRALQARLQGALGEALYCQDRMAEAFEVLEGACDSWRALGAEAELAAALSDAAMTLDLQERYAEAADRYRRADALAARTGAKSSRAIILANYGFSLRNAGHARRSIEPLAAAQALLEEVEGDVETLRRNLGQLGESHLQLGDYARALDFLHRALELSAAQQLPSGFLHGSLAETYLALGAFARAGEEVQAALAQPGLRDRLRGAILLTEARRRLLHGGDPEPVFARARTLLDPAGDGRGLGAWHLARAPLLPPARALDVALRVREGALERSLGALLPVAETRCAEALLALGRPREARTHSEAAVTSLRRYDPLDFPPVAVWFAHHRVLAACHDPAAREPLRRALAWLREVADRRTPREHRHDFLHCHPLHRAVLAAAAAGETRDQSSL